MHQTKTVPRSCFVRTSMFPHHKQRQRKLLAVMRQAEQHSLLCAPQPYSTLCMNQSCCIACHISRVIIIYGLFSHADVEYNHKRLSLHREEVCLPGEL